MSEQMTVADEQPEDEPPEYRLSHLMDAIADAFGDEVTEIAPMDRGGVKPRVQNRVVFRVGVNASLDASEVASILDAHGFAWTTAESSEVVVLGRAVTDLRELREGDRIHVNHRRGPFQVYRVLEQSAGPEVLQRSDEAITAELTNTDTGTDWMVVDWAGDDHPWSYVKTTDKQAKGGHRHRKVDPVEWLGRIGPRRLFAPPADVTEDVERYVPREVERAMDHYLGESRVIHPDDLARVRHLFQKPVAEAFTAEDATTVREFLLEMADWHERQAGGLEIEDDEDKALAAQRQESAQLCNRLANAFNVLEMDAVDVTDDVDLWECVDCGKAFLNRFKYPTHRRECPEREQADDQTSESETQS